MINANLVFDPLVPWLVLLVLGALVLVGTGVALWRGLAGWALRGLAGITVIAALTGPAYQRENRALLSDIVIMVVDQSASQQLGERPKQTQDAEAALTAQIAARPNTELRRVEVGDGEGDTGTRLMTALSEALAEEPLARVAGMFLISDGRLHDLDAEPALPAPLHLLQSGEPADWDRRLIVENAPAFAILGEEVTLTLRVEDSGNAPTEARTAPLEISIDGAAPQRFNIELGRTVTLPIELAHGGRNVLQFRVPTADGELTDRNNTALIQINGVRDRLRVLLVSGSPHPGGRTWRNLLKSDSSVDLVHFTILRPPEKQDGVPVGELSLIAFPTRELFLEKIDDFDLIIFDRYKRRGILPSLYLDNVRQYVEKGGAVLVAAGPDFAAAESLYRTPLASIFPARPTARVVEQGYRPEVTELGERHPVTAGLRQPDDAPWGRWMRQIEIEAEGGDTVMSGFEGRPLLVLDRVGEGRVALLASDHAWLWSRGFEGGGPQLELLRRLAHWMMKEPELEEEALWAEANGQRMRVIRRSLKESVGEVTITSPDGEASQLTLSEVHPGHFEALFEGDQIGLYRLKEGDQEAVIGLGPAAPREFEAVIADSELLISAIESTRGGVALLNAGTPSLRAVREGRPAAGRGWLGITPRGAYKTLNVSQYPLLPPWLVLLLVTSLIVGGWLREGRR